MSWRVEHGDCLEIMRGMDDASVDAICTDPPYGLGFMGKAWDHAVPGVEFWAGALRVARPGAHLLAFGGTRLFHRMMVAIEDAGWEVRDTLMWVYGSGFPKSHNLKDAWQGWGTALKPAWEPIVMARKPLAGTVAANVLAHGTGAINVDGCRVGTTVETWPASRSFAPGISSGYTDGLAKGKTQRTGDSPSGRWPANVLHDGSDEATAGMGPGGEASRYFYCPKASKADRDGGVAGVAGVAGGMSGRADGSMGSVTMRKNTHPTVKPHDLMRWLCRLVTPPGGTVLDPFAGSGSTGKAAIAEGFNFIGCELDADYVNIARQRIEHAQRGVA